MGDSAEHERFATLQAVILELVAPEDAADQAAHMRAIAAGLRGHAPGANSDALDLERVADTLDDVAALHLIERQMDLEDDQRPPARPRIF